MFWLILIVVAFVLIVMNNTKRGAEFIRAHVYLSGIEAGVSPVEVNATTLIPMSSIPESVIRDAKSRAKVEHNGKQLPIIRRAYAAGMTSQLPNWQRKILMAS